MNIGDLTLNVILNTAGTTNSIKQFEQNLKGAENQAKSTESSVVSLRSSMQNLGLNFLGVQAIVQTLSSSMGMLIAKYNEYTNAVLGLQSVSKFKGLDPEVVTKTIQGLDLVKSGLISVADASTSFKNLLSANFTLEQSVEIFKRFSDAASFGRQGSLSFGEAVRSATEGIKNGNSILVDNAGVTKNLSVMLQEAGYSAQDMMKSSSDAGVRMAIFNGIMRETQGQLGDASRLMDTSQGATLRFDKTINDLKISFGYLLTAAVPVLQPIGSLLEAINRAPQNVRAATLALIGLAGAMMLFGNSIPGSVKVFGVFASLMIALPPHLRLLVGGLALVSAAMIALNGQIAIANIQLGGLPLVIGLVVTGALGVSTALSSMTGSLGDFDKYSQSIKDYSTKINELQANINSLSTVYDGLINTTVMTEAQQSAYNKSVYDLSQQYPQILSQVDEYTTKLTINKTALEGVLKAEKDRLKIYQDARTAEQMQQLDAIAEKHKSEIQDLEFLTQKQAALNLQIAQGGTQITDEFGSVVAIKSVQDLQSELEGVNIKIGNTSVATDLMKKTFYEAIEQGKKFGNLEEVVERFRLKIGDSYGATQSFFAAMSAFTGQAVSDWNQVTAAVNNLKNTMSTISNSSVGPDRPTVSNIDKRMGEVNDLIKNEPDRQKIKDYQNDLKALQKQKDDLLGNTQKSTGSRSPRTSANKENDPIREAIDLWNKQIELYFMADRFKTNLIDKGKSLADVYAEINKQLAENNSLTADQTIALVNYRDKVLDMMKDSGITLAKLLGGGKGDEDPVKLAQQYVSERMEWYQQYGSKDKRFKPLDAADEFVKAIELIKQYNGDYLRQTDLINFANLLREKSLEYDLSSEESARRHNLLVQNAINMENEALKLKRSNQDFDVESSKIRINLINDEFLKRKREIDLTYAQELQRLEELSKAEKDNLTKGRLNERIDLVKRTRERELAELEKAKNDKIVSDVDSLVTAAQNISSILGIGAKTFVGQLLTGLRQGIDLARNIKEILEITGLFKSIFSLATGGASAALGGLPSMSALPNIPTSAGYFSSQSAKMDVNVGVKDFVVQGDKLIAVMDYTKAYQNRKRG